MLRHLMADIQEILNRSDLEPSAEKPRLEANQNLLTRLEESIDLLETNHPALRIMIEKALDTLNIAGI
jgi:hypothetical protein